MTKNQLQELAAAVSRALEAGKEAAAAAPDDGGSANLDCVYLCDLKGIREKTLHGAGIEGHMQPASTYRSRGFHLPAPFSGQGNRRYAGVQAMSKSLTADGVPHSIRYQMD
ncbi:hypothetical protein HX780_06540 [Pseudomonas tolaasii]|uniref:hypothetical protein n=1 Tax=Pseudomonas tolaasii TaxID=29442 RepID=UPI0015A1B86E|nr:hypothetical protein [Pseudomonas tolaasii]NVZ45090.1 hypothetical protein [Pseudomonas tolaasii]NWA47951.1 hypothetical protein [Pseudomonas tolaasii]